ncbi:MAG TPA: YqhA family protein [Phototrophicaceae bacterium]|jgi:uncharacterized membrane protein YqhA|nr:YqhA family protein [Phototrophicaceae bacterium]
MVERLIESILWNSRLVVLVPVLASLLLAFGMFIVTTVDAVVLLWHMISYLDPAVKDTVRTVMRMETIATIVAVMDGYLLAAIMLIFALGMYELFINKISEAEGSEFASRLLLIRSLDDLKDRLSNVILLILIVKFFQQALDVKYTSALDLLMLAIGIGIIAGAIFLTGRAKQAKSVLTGLEKR